ncbi:MAG: hypothetical protein U0547_02330 [Dehalococcoidia bacterium]
MYSIRVEPETNQLLVTLTGRVTTAEALRAASQAFTLAEAGRIAAIVCDTTALRRGPGGLLLVATALAAGHREGMRLALIGEGTRRRLAERLARYSRIPAEGIAAFESEAEARDWLAPVLRRAPRLSGTELRHVEALTRAPRRGGKRAARNSRAEGAA